MPDRNVNGVKIPLKYCSLVPLLFILRTLKTRLHFREFTVRTFILLSPLKRSPATGSPGISEQRHQRRERLREAAAGYLDIFGRDVTRDELAI